MKIHPIHPFPARMAPEIVFSRLSRLPARAVVLDPMSGSGTVLRAACEQGHPCLGMDMDPLAVLMAKVWTTPIDSQELVKRARDVVRRAKRAPGTELTWIENCSETANFVKFWFEPRQRLPLRKIARVLSDMRGPYANALRVALSRTIITKENGASIARDTSHSRPHRVFLENSYDVYEGFLLAASHIAARLKGGKLKANADISLGDARRLPTSIRGSVDAIVTSPPYLNAIDYMRGHRLALVWLGYILPELTSVRAASIGTEKMASYIGDSLEELTAGAGKIGLLSERQRGMVVRYALDMRRIFVQFGEVLKESGRIILVVGDSRLKGVAISNARICISAAKAAEFTCRARIVRELPNASRYLPYPGKKSGSLLSQRMKHETVLTFTR